MQECLPGAWPGSFRVNSWCAVILVLAAGEHCDIVHEVDVAIAIFRQFPPVSVLLLAATRHSEAPMVWAYQMTARLCWVT